MKEETSNPYPALLNRWSPTVQKAVNAVLIRSGFALHGRHDMLALMEAVFHRLIVETSLPVPPAPDADPRVFARAEHLAAEAVAIRAQVAGGPALSIDALKGPEAESAAWYETVSAGSVDGLPIVPDAAQAVQAALRPLRSHEQDVLVHQIQQALLAPPPAAQPVTTTTAESPQPSSMRRRWIVAMVVLGFVITTAVFTPSSTPVSEVASEATNGVPTYRLKVLSDPSDAKNGRVDFELQPDTPYLGELSIVAVLKDDDGKVKDWKAPYRRQREGQIRVQANLSENEHHPAGRWMLVLLIAAESDLIGDPFIAANGPLPEGVQRFQYVIRIPPKQ